MFKGLIALIFLVMVTALSVPGVYALWQYSNLPPAVKESDIGLGLKVFDYPPEEIVPDDELSTSIGENHLMLIQMVVDEASYGLNATKKPIIHKYLENPGDVVYCSQNTTGGNLKHLMIDSVSEADHLYFVITKISDTEYHTFTFRYADMTNYPVGTEIETYKTVMLKTDGVWEAKYSYYGVAKINAPRVVSRGIDVTSWRYVAR